MEIIPIEESPDKFIVPVLLASGTPDESVATVPLSTLIPILFLPAALSTFIVPVFVILSAALITRDIPVFPTPPDTLIIPVLVTFP